MPFPKRLTPEQQRAAAEARRRPETKLPVPVVRVRMHRARDSARGKLTRALVRLYNAWADSDPEAAQAEMGAAYADYVHDYNVLRAAAIQMDPDLASTLPPEIPEPA